MHWVVVDVTRSEVGCKCFKEEQIQILPLELVGKNQPVFTKDAEESHLCCIVLKPVQKHERGVLAVVVLGVWF